MENVRPPPDSERNPEASRDRRNDGRHSFRCTWNNPAWGTALKAAGNRDYSLVVIPMANHAMLEAEVGSKRGGQVASAVSAVVFTTIEDWLAHRGFH